MENNDYHSFEAARSILSIAGYDSPDREVMQIIENVFHRWYEYDLDGGERLIFLEEPCRKILDKKEIQELYNKSRQWVNGTEYYEMYMTMKKSNQYELVEKQIPSPEKHILPVEFKPKYGDSATSISNVGHEKISTAESITPATNPIETSNVIGTDDRLRIEETTEYPLNTVGYIESTYMEGGLYYRGTAFLVSPYIALTCAHNVYDFYYEWADMVYFYPGQYQSYEGGDIYWPYGYKSTTYFEICADYVDYAGYTIGDFSDYGALFFGEPFTGIDTFVPVVFNCKPEWVVVVGYPEVVRNEINSYAMWCSADYTVTITDYADYAVCFLADITPGTSGGPVLANDEVSDTPVVVSIAAGSIYDQWGSPLYNMGPAFDDYNRDLIMGWINWDPYVLHGDPNGDGDITVQDAIMVLRSVVGLVKLNEDQTLAADVDGSGSVDVNDAILILRYIVGLIGYFPVRY
ncbi:MAG: hypothetical protein GX364_05985 [Firmicutes bacterium]|jgi:V8-like Glu-specific endopeptidase|nr:hypothetical protein [Bacillota bacterium]